MSSFLLCLRRLAAAKGIPSLILSDNHKTFISGEKFLLDLQEDEEVQEFLCDHRIQWKHQTPRSPWMGGHFERLVRTIRTCLSSAIARKLYNHCRKGRSHQPFLLPRFIRKQNQALHLPCLCATTQAVHLEVVNNLSMSSFLLCLRRLAAAKGIPSLILSDNHKTFISGEKFLLDLQEDEEVQEFLCDHRIQWKHQTPRSPWMGGHFERLVRTIRTCLSSAIARKLYNQDEFTTVVKEVENIVNSRPLTYQANDALDQLLTPSQLLWGRNLTIMSHSCSPTLMTTQLQKQRNYDINISLSAMLWIVSGNNGPKNTSHPYMRNMRIVVPNSQHII